MLGWWLALGCELVDLIEPQADNVVDDLEVVWVQTTPPVAAPSSAFFIDTAIANPGLEDLRAFAFACLPDAEDCGSPLGFPIAELVLRCGSVPEPPCTDVRGSAGFQLTNDLLEAFPIDHGEPVPVDLPLFVAVCPTDDCPRALTAPVESPLVALGIDGTRPPDDDVGRLAVAFREIRAKPALDNRDTNPRLALLGIDDEGDIELTFRIGPGGRGVGNDVTAFTTSGDFTTGGVFERSNVVRGDVFRYLLEPDFPPSPTTVWVVLEERGSAAGAVFAQTFFSDAAEAPR
ncbi:MAG: hypothetical protein AAF602_04525 [Myxococcota bacterium]